MYVCMYVYMHVTRDRPIIGLLIIILVADKLILTTSVNGIQLTLRAGISTDYSTSLLFNAHHKTLFY